MSKSLESRIRRLERILKIERKPRVLKVRGRVIGGTTNTQQEKDHGPVDK